MKKILIILVLMAAVPAYATVEVKYNNAGAVMFPNTSQSNALFAPDNAQRAGEIQRQRKYEKMYYENLNKPREVNINLNTSTNEFSEDAKPSAVKERTFLKGKYLKDRLKKQTEE